MTNYTFRSKHYLTYLAKLNIQKLATSTKNIYLKSYLFHIFSFQQNWPQLSKLNSKINLRIKTSFLFSSIFSASSQLSLCVQSVNSNSILSNASPILLNASLLSAKKLIIYHKKVTIQYELKQLQQINFLEIDQLTQSLAFFSTQNQTDHKSNSTLTNNDVANLKKSPASQKIIQQFPQLESTSIVLNS